MRYLLDTNAWLWSVGATELISKAGLSILTDGSQEIHLSVASMWEVMIKAAAGKLALPELPPVYVSSRLARQGVRSLPINQAHVFKVHDLPHHHRDPFDRLLIAQAMVEGMTILTADGAFRRYDVDIVWCGK